MKARQASAFTLFEVMIAMAILGVVLTSVASGMYSLNFARRGAQERAIAQTIAQALSERVLGGTWDNLGKNLDPSVLANRNCWSWHRREFPTAADSLPPLDEVSQDPTNRLDPVFDNSGTPISSGILPGKSGLQDARVYLEYYRMGAIDAMMASADARKTWYDLVRSTTSPQVFDDTSGFRMDLRNEIDAVLVRILVTWSPASGSLGRERYEVVFSRRK